MTPAQIQRRAAEMLEAGRKGFDPESPAKMADVLAVLELLAGAAPPSPAPPTFDQETAAAGFVPTRYSADGLDIVRQAGGSVWIVLCDPGDFWTASPGDADGGWSGTVDRAARFTTPDAALQSLKDGGQL